MAESALHLTGYIVGAGGLGAILLLNQFIFRRRWQAYPTAAQYLAAHPGCSRRGASSATAAGTNPPGWA